MSRSTCTEVVRSLGSVLRKHGPEVLTGIGIAGMVTTVVMAVKATPKAMRMIESEKDRRNQIMLENAEANGRETCSRFETLPAKDVVKTAWTCYIPATVTGAASVACLVGANAVGAKRGAALAAAYTLSERTLTEYQDKVVETIGKKKEQSVRDAIAKDKLEQNPVSTNEVVVTHDGDTLCYDVISGRYFRSDIDKLKKAENVLNRRLLEDTYVSLNEFYYEIGLRGISIGDDLGWNVNKDNLVSLDFSSQLSESGTPCLVVGYRVAPRRDYDKWF